MTRSRFVFIPDQNNLLMTVRAIGDMPGDVLADHIITAYRSIEAPWTFNRIIDLRRHTGYVSDGDRGRIASAWSEITAGVDFHAHVAMLMHDLVECRRLPRISADFPNETICLFTDYHEAIGWLMAADRDMYLAGLPRPLAVTTHDDSISIH